MLGSISKRIMRQAASQPMSFIGTARQHIVGTWVIAVMAVTCSNVAAEVTIEVTADPPLPVANLFVNPGLEKGTDHPESWGVGASIPEVVDFDYRKSGGVRGAYLRVDAHASTSNGYLCQQVSVQPGTAYRAGIWVRIRGGTMVMWLHAWVHDRLFDKRKYLKSYAALPLIPDFVKLEWTASPDPNKWVWVGREFRTWPGQTHVTAEFGAYFDQGSMDLDEPFIGLARTTLHLKIHGAPLQSVRVLNQAGDEVFTSDGLPDGTTSFERALTDLPTDTRYKITVTTTDGEVTDRWYPAAK